jgi:hypothetical protein
VIGTSTAPSYPFSGPKPAGWENPFDTPNRRKPRMYASVDMGVQPRPNPWPIEFCMWLMSDEFGNSRRYILKSVGSTWLGYDATINEGISEWLNSLQQRVTRSRKGSLPGQTEATR